MRKIISTLIIISFLAISGAAYATTWTDVQNPNDVLLHKDDSTTVLHNLGNGGFVPGTDVATSVVLTIDLDNGTYKGKLIYLSEINLNTPDPYPMSFVYDNDFLGVTLSGLMTLNDDGMLSVIIRSLKGDFNFNMSTLEASNALPVPEPGTSALLGTGLIALGFFLRRRLTV